MDDQQTLIHLHTHILQETRRRLFDDSISRTKKCLHFLSDEEIWYKPNEQSNSVGNLVLHVCGNARQWLISGLGGAEDIRQRQTEFDEQGPLPKKELFHLLEELQKDLEELFKRLGPKDLVKVYGVQGFKESGLGIIMHVVEHFSYHVGQMTYFVKAKKNIDTGYFAGVDLEAKG